MSALRKSRAMQDQIQEMRTQGYKLRAIARALKIHRDTVRAYLADDDLLKTSAKKSPEGSDIQGQPPWQKLVR